MKEKGVDMQRHSSAGEARVSSEEDLERLK